MKTLHASDYVTMTIDENGTRRFEAFLDRNYPGWRHRQMFEKKYAGTIRRRWRIGIDDVERTAFYRKQYVEVLDETFEGDDDATIHQTRHVLCDIDGDTTQVAVWGLP